MWGLFDFIGSAFGYLLWFFYDAVSNYALAITLFTIVVNVFMFPFSINQKKTLAHQARMAAKQAELKKIYANNPKKYKEEELKLYERESVNPLSGCLTMFFPLILLWGIYDAIRKPLQSVLHIAADKIAQAVSLIPNLLSEIGAKAGGPFEQLVLVRHFPQIQDHLTMFNPQELSAIKEYSLGFNFFGINLLTTPSEAPFSAMVWVIPALCVLFQAASMYVSQRQSPQQQGQGCMKYAMYGMVLFIGWMCYTIPAAVGFYWIVNSVIKIFQDMILNKFYSPEAIAAKKEASRIALLEIQEKEGS